MFIGITGSIACGKSTVSDYLYSLGYKVVDCDKLSHEVIKKGRVAYYEVVYHFSQDILLKNREINRKKLGEIVFDDPEKRKLLESIIHPKVQKALKRYRQDPLVFVEVPLLYETHMEKDFFKVIVVECTKENQIERLMARNDLTRESAKKRIDLQMPIEDKVKLADYVVKNDQSIEDIKGQLDKILKNIIENY